MSTLLNQAPEVLHEIFKRAAPSDLASISSTCKFLNTFVTRDTLLWRQQYLAHFDLPAKTETEPNWQHLLKTNINIEKLLKSSDVSLKTEEALIRVVELASSLLQTATPSAVLNTAWLRRMFVHDESNISSFLCRSSLFRGARLGSNTPASTTALRQMSAKLQVFSGLDVEADCSRMDRPLGDVQLVHSYARARVYDLRRYKQANHWGPFTDDGTSAIDWEKVQAIMLDLCFNIRMYKTRRARPESTRYYSPARRGDLGIGPGFWDKPFWGLAPNSFKSQPQNKSSRLANNDDSDPSTAPPDPAADLNTLDPYGVAGTWMRIVCFLDYSDLYNFNFDNSTQSDPIMGADGQAEREPIETREAFRLIKLKLHVTSVDDPEEGVDHPDFPVVSFEGTSRSMLNSWDPNANSRIRGEVRTTPSGAIRWTTWSIFHGEERWRSEGVQVGGIRSARGILGNWFDKDYDAAGPAGPTAFWKISDEMVEDEPKSHGGMGHWWANHGVGAAGEEASDEEDDPDWVDADDDEEGNGAGEVVHLEGGETPGDRRAQALAEFRRLLGGGVGVEAGSGFLEGQAGSSADGSTGGGGQGMVLPLHEVVQLLAQAMNGGGGRVVLRTVTEDENGGQEGEIELRLEDLQGFLN